MNLQVENEIVHEDGVSVQRRESDKHCYLFVMNFTEQKQSITVKEPLYDLLTEEIKQEHIELLPYEVMVLKKEK
ncbi:MULTISPECIES: Beta-galactosidase C-terminal domain [unclassified Bacillus (in: firmicutes)]|uniref:Beta-galactosidase C-terminal domain n=1 Tax=unclassified Bacillus (in: firmicutes) TaxID=185979 RepID=UPI0022AF940B|nr:MULTISPECIES: Beta-galactosidase C-terminal domain [unclassified Bacillus (in: firmicutes)]